MTGVTVIIPSYNAEQFIGHALQSALTQSRSVESVVVVDDASTDGTAAVVERIAAEGHPVRCVRVERNGGPAVARNIGLRESSSPLVAFLDADDWWEPDHCAELAGLLDRHPEAVLAFGGWRVEGRRYGPGWSTPAWSGPAEATWMLLDDNMVLQSAVMVRRDTLEAVGGYDERIRYTEDYELWNRLAERGPFVASERCTAVRREHDAQLSWARRPMIVGAWSVRRAARERLAQRGSEELLRRADGVLRRAFEREVEHAWHYRDRALLLAILQEAPREVAGMEDIVRRCRRRIRFVWPVWRGAAAVWDAVPERVRTLVRSRPRVAAAGGSDAR